MTPTPAAKLLVVDDEPNIRDLLATSLKFAGFEVETAASGGQAVASVIEHDPDLLVLDVMLPDMDGFTVTRRLRDQGNDVPVLFLTARDQIDDKLHGLTIGGDDYVTKPFSLEEVIVRINAILRRTRGVAADDAIISVGDLELDEDSHEVRRAGIEIKLSPTEFKLLRYLMVNAGRVLSKAQILDHVWDYGWTGDNGVVESYISYLRRKLDVRPDGPDGPELPPLIQTKWGFGYLIRAPHVES
ncbi:MAG: response regulator transcription factor [Bifidobacteriaceae bacterium]|jgi:two-component system OmpR family response regulator|nr:response regulator transcription factor [Bifidobacteriaceae bacterium]